MEFSLEPFLVGTPGPALPAYYPVFAEIFSGLMVRGRALRESRYCCGAPSPTDSALNGFALKKPRLGAFS
jgi:hypothetical protein